MNIQTAFTYITDAIVPLYTPREAANVAHLVLEHLTGLTKLDRIVFKEKLLDDYKQTSLKAAVDALLQEQPVQYVTGTAWFWGMELLVNPDVLIPRPETEELADWIISDARDSHATHIKILDIGTGSGCIPLALKKELHQATVWGLDVSPGAIATAQSNAARQHLDVHFQQTDILDAAAVKDLPGFDVIVSNPPYIKQSEHAGMQTQVLKYEPNLALFVPDEDALLFYRHIGLLALEKLPAGGKLYFEINEAHGHEVIALLQQQGFLEVQLKQDIFGKDRMVKAVRG